MKRKRLLFPLLLIILLLNACSGNSNSEGKRVIKIGHLPITHAGPLLLQAEQEYPDYKIELVKFSSWPDLMEALSTGRIDGASVLIQMAMKAKERGVDLKVVALGHRDGNVIITSPEIKQTKDLIGKTFAIPNKYSTHHFLLYQMLKKDKIPYEKVNIVELPPPEMPAALAEGRISGYVVAEPFGAIAVASGKGKVLFQSEEIWPNSIDCGLVLRQAFIDQNRQLAKTFVQDYAKAGHRGDQDVSSMHRALKKHLSVNDKVMDLSLKWISYYPLTIDRESYKILTDTFLELGLSKKPPTYDEFVDPSLITSK